MKKIKAGEYFRAHGQIFKVDSVCAAREPYVVARSVDGLENYDATLEYASEARCRDQAAAAKEYGQQVW